MIKHFLSYLKYKGISPYLWAILFILPFYFIFQSTSNIEIVFGILLTIFFIIIYPIAFFSRGWIIYLWTLLLISICILLTVLFSFIYFAFFIAHLIGNIRKRITFFVLYFILIFCMTGAINYNIVTKDEFFLEQLPLVIITCISIILLPFTIRNRNQVDRLEEKLEDANKKIAELVKLEERERIARDLHDTLGQKLALIGLKSDLARKVMINNPEQAKNELKDVQQTARTALNEVRKMVSSMRSIRLTDEMIHIKQLLDVANIELVMEEEHHLTNLSLLTENILSMCLKESVTNIVKHSGATKCTITFNQTSEETTITVEDNGTFIQQKNKTIKRHGLTGMRERLEFVNGTLEIVTKNGTKIIITVPNESKQAKEDAQK